MKNKILKFIGVIVITTFILSYLSSAVFVSAAKETPGLILETSDSKNIGMGILHTERPVATTLQVTSNISGGFTYQDFLGNDLVPEDFVYETEDSDLYYPVNLRYENFWNQDKLREFKTYYATARNVSDLPDQYGNYSFSLMTEQYSLSKDKSCEIAVSDLTSEILFDAKSKGIYQIWLNNINIVSLNILSPTDQIVTPVINELPPVVHLGPDSLGKYFYFAVYETGTYKIYIETGDPIIKLRADYHKPESIKFGEAVYGGKDPSDPTFFDTVYTMDVYQINIKDLETINRYLLDFEYGTPDLYYFVEDDYNVYYLNLLEGINQVLPSVTTGKIYIVIDNPDYFSWADPGIDEANPLKYTLKIDQIEPLEHIIGDNETINLAKSVGVTARTFEIVNTSLISLHFEDVGSNSPNIVGTGGNFIQKIDEDKAQYISVASYLSGINGTFVGALLEPGKYRVIIQHSGSMGPEYLHFYSKNTDLKTLNVEDMDLSGFSSYNYTTLDFEDVTLPTWENYPNIVGATYPIGFNFSIDENFWDYGYNVSIHTDKNPDVFEDYINSDLAFLWDDTTNSFTDYTNSIQPGNSQKVPVKTDGGSVGDALIIGSYDKFDSIVVNLADPSDRDAFEWQYYRDSFGWRNIDLDDSDFNDGTLTATGSLNKSGTVSWDPDQLTNWNYVTRTSNSSASELPDTDDQDYYLIRVRCTDASASIANITSVRFRKFINLNLYIVNKLAFNIGTQETPDYYSASGYSVQNLNLIPSDGHASYTRTSHTIDKNYNSKDAIFYLYAKRLRQLDYNGSDSGNYIPIEKPLTFSVCVFQPDNHKRIIDYNISDNVPTSHSNQLNLSTLTSDMQKSIDIPDRLTLYLNITPRNMYDWTQFNVQFVNASVISTKLILPAKYDRRTIGTYAGTYTNGEFNLPYTGVNMNASIEFGFITETAFLEFVIQNTTNDPAILKVFGGQFNYPSLTVLEALPGTNWYLYGGIGGGVVVLIVVSIIYYKKKHPV